MDYDEQSKKCVPKQSVTCPPGAEPTTDSTSCKCKLDTQFYDTTNKKCINKAKCESPATNDPADQTKCLCDSTLGLILDGDLKCKCSDNKDYTNNKCVEKTKSDKDKCTEKNTAWRVEEDKKDNSIVHTDRYVWDPSVTPNVCKDRQAKASSTDDDSAPDDSTKTHDYPNKTAPARFQPVTIPVRQMWILPGMP